MSRQAECLFNIGHLSECPINTFSRAKNRHRHGTLPEGLSILCQPTMKPDLPRIFCENEASDPRDSRVNNPARTPSRTLGKHFVLFPLGVWVCFSGLMCARNGCFFAWCRFFQA